MTSSARIITANILGTIAYLLIGAFCLLVGSFSLAISRAYRSWGANPPLTSWDRLLEIALLAVLVFWLLCLVLFYRGHRRVGAVAVMVSSLLMSLALYTLMDFRPFRQNDPFWHSVGMAPFILCAIHLGLTHWKQNEPASAPARTG